VFLMFPDNFFLLGVLSFGLAHISYLIAFIYNVKTRDEPQTNLGKKAFFTCLMIVYGISMYLYLFPKLSSDFKIPIGIYVVLLITMVIVSLFRDNKTGEKSFYFVFIGAILFAISDSILSLTLFDGRKGIYMRLACITPYFFGQWMIYWGCLHHKENEIRKLK